MFRWCLVCLVSFLLTKRIVSQDYFESACFAPCCSAKGSFQWFLHHPDVVPLIVASHCVFLLTRFCVSAPALTTILCLTIAFHSNVAKKIKIIQYIFRKEHCLKLLKHLCAKEKKDTLKNELFY